MTTDEQTDTRPLTDEEVGRIDAYWRAANYLSVGQIYLLANPLLHEPLTLEHVKPRLLGHWGTTPGLNFVYVHLNRLIREHGLSVLYVTGPGHGGPGVVANTYLEGSYTEHYPDVTQDAEGMRRLFRQFSFPGGIPSHTSPETPGSINEGGELGYSLAHAYGAAATSLPFVPEVVLPTLRRFEALHVGASSPYGFESAFNPTFPTREGDPAAWTCPWVYGIDQGALALMFENHRTGLVWERVGRSPYVREGLRRAGFDGGWLGSEPAPRALSRTAS